MNRLNMWALIFGAAMVATTVISVMSGHQLTRVACAFVLVVLGTLFFLSILGGCNAVYS